MAWRKNPKGYEVGNLDDAKRGRTLKGKKDYKPVTDQKTLKEIKRDKKK